MNNETRFENEREQVSNKIGQWILIIIFLISLIIVIYLWWNQEQSKEYTGFLLREPFDEYVDSVEELTLGVEPSLVPAAVWVAEDEGYFQEQGLNLTIKEFDSGSVSFLDMLNGGVDISTVSSMPIVADSFNRQDFSIFATFAYSYEDIKVIARKDKGINLVADLEGKKIGASLGTIGQFFLDAFLICNKISSSGVEVVNFDPPDLPEALSDGRVDAIVIWEPYGYEAKDLVGDKIIELPTSEIYKETFNFMVMNNFANENTEALKRFLRAIDKATIFIKDHQDESQSIVIERLNLNRKKVKASWDDFVFDISLKQSLIMALEEEARWAIKNNLTDKAEVPDYLNYIYIDALKEVKPESVGIIH